jgi:NAD(P)-dependent dehydrogenase (short-subunit alcohol dehydrogenase family)
MSSLTPAPGAGLLQSTTEPRAALITGGGQRLGAAMARALAQQGWRVVIHANTSVSSAQALANELRQAGGWADVVTADLADAGQVATLVARAVSLAGPLTSLINNASLFEPDAIAGFDPAYYARVQQVNVAAPLQLIQAFAAQAGLEAVDRCVINLVDQRVLRLNPTYLSYTLSKAALWTLTQTCAQALAPQVRVNAIGPGPTLQNQQQDGAAFAAEWGATPLERPVSPDDIATAALYLLRARTVTGQLICVDSGQHLAWRTPDVEAGLAH